MSTEPTPSTDERADEHGVAPSPVVVRRTGSHVFTGSNPRGATVTVGRDGAEGAFTPGELLLVAAAGCAAVTAETLVLRRVGQDTPLVVHADRDKESPDAHEFSAVHVGFDVDLGALDEQSRAALKDTVDRAIARLCTVSRTLERGVGVGVEFDGATQD